MGNSPMYPPPDNQEHPESGNGRYRRQRPEPRDTPQYPEQRDERWHDRQPYSTPAQYRRQLPESWETSTRVESWNEPEWYPGPPRNEQYSGAWGSDNGGPAWQPAQPPQQGLRTYPTEPGDRRQAYEARVSRSRELGGATQRRTGSGRPEPQQSGNLPQPGTADSGTTAGNRFSPGWVSAVVVFTLLGLGLDQIADSRALHGKSLLPCVYLFFVGLIFIFSPITVRVLMRKTGRTERFALVMLLGIVFYMVKIQAEPNGFLLNDEFIHLRNTQNILSSGHLFLYNPLLPTAAYYPGLAAVTATLVNLTGLSIFASGLIIIGVARLLITACLYLVAEKVTGSSRGAGTASLLYAANPCYLFWTAEFAYEDLALPLAAFTVWWICRTRGTRGRVAAQVITVIAIVAVTVTHHISGFALFGILALLYIAERFLGYPSAERRYLGIFAALTGVLTGFWFFVVAKPAVSYLFGQNIDPAVQEALSVLSGRGGRRQLYGNSTASAPQWYVYVGFLATLVILAALLPAVIRAWRLLRARGFAGTMQRRAPIAVATIIAISFPFTLLPRLTADGGAISARTSEFVFTALGCTLGLLMENVARSTRIGIQRAKSLAPIGGLRILLATLLLSLVLVGEVSIGNSFFALLPAEGVGFSPYVQPYMINAANWSRQHLGAYQTFATDATNQLALGTYGEENPANVNVIYPIFFTASMNSMVVNMIKANHIYYLLLDWLETEELPVRPGGSYYSSLEPDASLNGKPLPKAYFSKFATYTCSRLVYQSGSIQIYDVSQIANGSCVPHLIHNVPTKASSGKKSNNPEADHET